ncbi:helix-hairpin-helix domain-containing protein, partial [Enterococcus faecalis]
IAKQIQKEVWSTYGIYVTIGIGPNPLMAKLAMDIEAKHTASGVAQWTYQDVPKIWTIPKLEDMWGIGTRTAKKLRLLGIRSIKDLANSTPEKMKKHFGIIGLQLFYHCHGVDYSILSERVQPKSTSYGNSQILPKDYLEQSQVEIVLREMTEKLA